MKRVRFVAALPFLCVGSFIALIAWAFLETARWIVPEDA
jgi:cellobiose-specific phosphotransferase system component IIC